MRRFFRLPNLLLLAASIFIVNACTVDENPFVLGPNVSLGSGTDFISSDATVGAGAAIRVNLIAIKGDNDMQSVEFLENNVRIDDLARITINGAPAGSNAPLLFDTDVESFDWDVTITAHSAGTNTYTFVVSDGSGNSEQQSIDITIEDAEPTISFVGQGTTVDVLPNTWHTIKVNVETNGSPLTNISVWEDGALVTNLSRLAFGELSSTFSDNPHPLTGDDVNGIMDKDLFIQIDFAGEALYTIQVENTAGKTASGEFVLRSGTPFIAEFQATLLSNADGPATILGGLDLSEGLNVSVNSPAADIIDRGIASPTDPTWIQKIAPANGASMRELTQAQVDSGFGFESITGKELLQIAWDSATPVSEATNQVQVDDVFLIQNATESFIIKCVEVNVTTTNNEDNYKFDVKYSNL